MSYYKVLSQIYDCTYKMLELAQSKLWPELIDEENKRAALIENLKLYNPETESEKETEKKLKEIIDINHLITSLSIKEKDACLNSFNQSKVSKKATAEYTRY